MPMTAPWLTGVILLAIACGALLFSMLFERYTWCRYACPLGALNAVFSMPSILELRANQGDVREPVPGSCLLPGHGSIRRLPDVPASVPGGQQQGLYSLRQVYPQLQLTIH